MEDASFGSVNMLSRIGNTHKLEGLLEDHVGFQSFQKYTKELNLMRRKNHSNKLSIFDTFKTVMAAGMDYKGQISFKGIKSKYGKFKTIEIFNYIAKSRGSMTFEDVVTFINLRSVDMKEIKIALNEFGGLCRNYCDLLNNFSDYEGLDRLFGYVDAKVTDSDIDEVEAWTKKDPEFHSKSKLPLDEWYTLFEKHVKIFFEKKQNK